MPRYGFFIMQQDTYDTLTSLGTPVKRMNDQGYVDVDFDSSLRVLKQDTLYFYSYHEKFFVKTELQVFSEVKERFLIDYMRDLFSNNDASFLL